MSQLAMSDRHCRLRRHDRWPAETVLGVNGCRRVMGAQREGSRGRPYGQAVLRLDRGTSVWKQCNGIGDCEVVQRGQEIRLHQPEDGGAGLFVHISAVEKAGYTDLAEGVRVSYELMAGRSGKRSAENLPIG